MGFEQEREDLEQALNSGFTPRWLSTVVVLAFYGFMLIWHGITSTALGLGVESFLGVLAWMPLLFFSGCSGLFLTVTYIGPLLFHHFTGLYYRRERIAYARAGGYDVNQLPPWLVQAALFGVWWWTSDQVPDPLPLPRSIWLFALLCIVLNLAVSAGLYALLFWRVGRR